MQHLKTKLFCLLSAMTLPAMMAAQSHKTLQPLPKEGGLLLPQPKTMTFGKGYYTMGKGGNVIIYNKVGDGLPAGGYRLHVTTDSLQVSFADSAGEFYAHQTLAQLRHDSRVPVCDITDWPSYPWRGCMIDVSRHFFPIDFLFKQIDVLAHYKINRLHLHLTDAAGWRMQIDRYPLLTKRAAWRTESDWQKWWIDNDRRYMDEGDAGAYGGYYTKDELRRLVDYARQRGITVVPEIEMPGHSEELTAAYPELKCEGNRGAQGDVCPSNEAVYAFLHNVLDEVMDVFPSHWIHIGGDEAGKEHWKECPRCQLKARMLGLRDVSDLQGYLIQRMADYLRFCGREAIGWDEVLDDSLPPYAPSLGENMNVMVWRDLKAARNAMTRGHNVILTPGEYYLDRYQDAPPTQPYAMGSYMPLRKMWETFNPADFADPAARGKVIGVQGNLWTEFIPTAGYAEYMLYPRILGIAQVGWSGRTVPYAQLRQEVISQYPWLETQGVNAFDLRREAGDRKEAARRTRHIALGAEVSYNSQWSPRYPGKGAATLTDGYGGGWNYGDGAWQGFLQTADSALMPLDVTIDLGSVRRFRRVSLDFTQSSGAWVYYPHEVVVSTSEDGKAFTDVYRKTFGKNASKNYTVSTFVCPGNYRGRYVRVRARAFGAGEWLFTDEVRVE